MTDHAVLVSRSLDEGSDEEFERRVRRQAEALVDAIEAGEFDNEDVTLGLELEAYAVRDTDAGLRLAPLPTAVFDGPAAKELGLHDVELNTAPSTFDAEGIGTQAATLEEDLAATRELAREHGCEVVLDAMWAVPPAEGTLSYLDDVEEVRAGDGRSILVARNMRRDPRYGALDNEAVRRAGGEIEFSVPGADLSFRTILFESLATSIQPHLQVPEVDAFARYHNLAIRTLGPVLALATNSPFLPADCYGDTDPRALIETTHHELRIAAFEQSMNQRCQKVRVPRDLDTATDVVDHVVADDTFTPFLCEWIEDDPGDGDAGRERGETDDGSLLDDCWEFKYKRSTFWRWVRGVVGGTAVDGACGERSLRIEYRPLPTQPTVRDVAGLQALAAGLLHGLTVADHPLDELPWAAAERSFYGAAEAGIGADLEWVDADGERTTDGEEIFAEVFEYARRGLADRGVPREVRERYLAPLEARWDRRITPSVWKVDRVREAVEEGADLAEALEGMQREYVRHSRDHDTFADWL
jgi:hypothetical protein